MADFSIFVGRQATRGGGVALLAGLLAAGCASPMQERVEFFNEDGVHLFSKGDYRAARDSFELALTLTPDDPGLLYNLGRCCDRLGETQKAEQYYVQCLQIDDKHAEARLAYADLLQRTGRQEQANRMILTRLQDHPNKVDALVLDAWRLRQERALPLAHGRLQQALALDPHHPRALTELGILYEEMGLPDRSLVLYERALLNHPDQTEVARRLESLKARGVSRPLPD